MQCRINNVGEHGIKNTKIVRSFYNQWVYNVTAQVFFVFDQFGYTFRVLKAFTLSASSVFIASALLIPAIICILLTWLYFDTVYKEKSSNAKNSPQEAPLTISFDMLGGATVGGVPQFV
ncbi:hypothetical protein LSAT2_006685 [Lamellibrachia satsuma]|nr:hypothetical protein LSAT2_006685 [Lamellibrachia satsuma]